MNYGGPAACRPIAAKFMATLERLNEDGLSAERKAALEAYGRQLYTQLARCERKNLQ